MTSIFREHPQGILRAGAELVPQTKCILTYLEYYYRSTSCLGLRLKNSERSGVSKRPTGREFQCCLKHCAMR